ncbi:HAD family phosphatase [uncultured Cohaesibacter sp.]|uniref:HAD family hydrolase n=1 Tax=uncultured Cohaesibacter sp. TaxID=1002546 RepID=UPI0029312E73|nr:HAD family phosphatase [uncultured Cohaesibacter sp.]
MPNQLLSKVDAVIFDFDGVVVDSEQISLGELQKSFSDHGITVTWKDLVQNFLGTTRRDVTRFMLEQTGRDPFPHYPHPWEERVHERLSEQLALVEGAEALLDRLDEAKIPYCLASGSSPERLRLSLDTVGQTARFEGRMFSTETVPNGKPAPDIFLHAAKALGVDPARAMVIEDGIAGTIGAKAAGVRYIVGFVGGSHLSDADLRERHGKALSAAGSTTIIDRLLALLD